MYNDCPSIKGDDEPQSSENMEDIHNQIEKDISNSIVVRDNHFGECEKGRIVVYSSHKHNGKDHLRNRLDTR